VASTERFFALFPLLLGKDSGLKRHEDKKDNKRGNKKGTFVNAIQIVAGTYAD